MLTIVRACVRAVPIPIYIHMYKLITMTSSRYSITGRINGVENLRIIDQAELREREPGIAEECVP